MKYNVCVCIHYLTVMFPYDGRLLRCHPCWVQMRSPVTDGDMHITNHRKLYWKCCECDCVFNAATHNLIRSSCRCAKHSIFLRTRMRPRYTGSISSPVSRPIRAGLLQQVDNQALFKLVVSLVQMDTAAQSYIDQIAQFHTAQLLDGGFWWEDTNQRQDGRRHKPPPRRRKLIAGDSTHSTTQASDIKESDHKILQAAICQDPVEHMWDDVLQAIHEDPRAFWGLWSSVIAPRLGPDVPQTLKENDKWTGSNANITEAIFRLMNLGRRLANLIEDNKLIIKQESEVVMYTMLLRNINNDTLKTPGEKQFKDLTCIIGMILGVNATARFTYAMPVD